MLFCRNCRHWLHSCCHFHNFQRSQWRKFHQNDISVSMIVISNISFVADFLCEKLEPRYLVPLREVKEWDQLWGWVWWSYLSAVLQMALCRLVLVPGSTPHCHRQQPYCRGRDTTINLSLAKQNKRHFATISLRAFNWMAVFCLDFRGLFVTAQPTIWYPWFPCCVHHKASITQSRSITLYLKVN